MKFEEREEYRTLKDKLELQLQPKKEFKVLVEDEWNLSQGMILFDLMVYRRGNPFAVIEFKKSVTDSTIKDAVNLLKRGLKITKARFGILTDGTQFFVWDKGSRLGRLDSMSIDGIISLLVDPPKIMFDKSLRKHLAQMILNSMSTLESKSYEFFVGFEEFLNKSGIENKLEFDEKSNTICFTENDSGLSGYENKFFKKLLGGDTEENAICRYTSLDSVFQTLKNVSFRMSGIVGMNDKTEVNYVDTYLDGVETPINKLHHNTISALNNRYITSCTHISKKDDLTMWRLYAEDCTGVCLIFKTNSNKLNNHMLLQEVNYADENGIHPELEFLKSIKNTIEDFTGLPFTFRKLNYWKHFFKPYEYSIEREVRLLIIDSSDVPITKKDWVLTNSHSLINPVIDFQLNHPDFPITLTEIILGPKSPEQQTNKVQIEELLRRKKNDLLYGRARVPKIDVHLSKIKHYR